MTHNQTGYQAAWSPDQATYMAILHSTCVVYAQRVSLHSMDMAITLNSGGHHTASTLKAIRGALKDLCLDSKIDVRLKDWTLEACAKQETGVFKPDWQQLNDNQTYIL